MFDIGFLELVVIGVVALIVIGPDKLPAVARTVGYWFGKTRRFVATVQEDFQREVSKSEELKRLLEEQSKIKEMDEIIEQTVDETRKSVSVGAKLDNPQNKLEATNDAEPQDTSAAAIANESQSQGSASQHASATASPTAPKSPSPADQVNEQAK